MGEGGNVVINLSGRGDKDVDEVARVLEMTDVKVSEDNA